MAARRKQQVCLRGASAREITRDALLERVSQERELRNYNRKTVNAALFIQRIWRSYHVKSKFMGDLQHEWETKVSKENLVMNSTWISTSVLRPFLFFVSCTSTTHQKVAETRYGCMLTCFDILLHSINSTDPEGNYCALALGTAGEKRIWLYQTQKLVSVCFRTLVECNTIGSNVDSLKLISLAMRLVVSLTDSKNWKSLNSVKLVDSELPINDLVRYMATGKSNLYGCIRKYIMKYEALTISMKKDNVKIADHFLIVASVMTLALRPFHVMKDANENFFSEVKEAAENFSTYVLTIPWLTKCIPSILLPALKHESVLRHCLNAIVVADEKIFTEMSRLDKQETNDDRIPSIGWALANIINLATEDHKRCGDSERFVDGLDCALYICAMNKIAEKLVKWIENLSIPCEKLNQGRSFGSGNVCFMDLLMPVQKQWHLMFLLNWSKNYLSEVPCISSSNHVYIFHKLRFQDIAFFYSCMLRAFSSLNPLNGSLPILNTLSFTPGFLVELWNVLEGFLWYESNQSGKNNVKYCNVRINDDANSENEQTQVTKDTSNKWINVLQKITGKSLMIANHEHSSEEASVVFKLDEEEDPNPFYIETLRKGSQCLSKDMSSLLHLFYAAYSHLLIVLDDIEFYQRQVPFVLDQQCKIASVVNTLVYNSLVYNNGQNTPLIDAAIRCLRLLYERDCRHKFCPPSLWTAPSRGCRTPQATVVRVNEASSSSLRPGDTSLITTTPHVFPFEERVKMFREFIRLDKVSQRMIGEIAGPGPGSIEIVIRRNHIVEDGFQQLNFLGSRLKLGIHVSFVSECGLLEAGLDYGGLSKEFLTDISSAVFSPEYGLFSQTSTSERYLIPSASARLIDNGFQMIEFLGRVVGKALYEGILLDYSFSLVFIQKLLGCYSFIDELSTLDPELYKNVMYVKHYDGDVRELCLDFTITEEVLGNRIVTELKPGGKNVTVTNDNKLQYVHAIADYKLNRQVLPMANAFYRGLTDLISPSWLSLFNANEFNQLLSGGNHDFDVEDLRSNTLYTGGYSEGNRTIKLFWEVVAGFEPKERCKLLKFVTSCSRAPLLGFKHLQPAFTIHKVPCDVPLWAAIGGQDVDRLPSASTCYNTLKLPTYKRASTLKLSFFMQSAQMQGLSFHSS